MLDLLKAGRHVRQVWVINGLVRGSLTRAWPAIGMILRTGARPG